MAERRMFAKTIIDSDAFLDMPMSTQALYFHLGMRADDEGFINNPRKIMRMVGCSEDDMRVLIAKKFVITFDSGIVVIRHWRIHNYIQRDRFKSTLCSEEKAQLEVSDAKTYEISQSRVLPACIQNVSGSDTQVRLGKVRLGKVSLEEGDDAPAIANAPKPKKPVKHKHGTYSNVLLTDEELAKLQEEFPNDWSERIERLSEYVASTGKRYKSHLATIRSWARKDKAQHKQTSSEPYGIAGNDYFEVLDEIGRMEF